ncbi:MAG: amidohydrolase [Rhodobacter sp.]|nr:amidohydrolase [Paracoccaceae bacterium]MCC0080554.1 amidohydrolase [Rhodobacter sp.]
MTQAELILTNARIRTMDPGQPRAEALAIGGGHILAVGSAAEIAVLTGPGTRVHDLHGRAIIPGLIDSHTHGLWGATRDTLEVFTGFASSHAELLEAVRTRAATQPPGSWIAAGPWKIFQRAELGARPADLLDRFAPDHPVAIKDITHHALWVNSAALAAAGIGPDTPDPEGGEIERDADGRPTGILNETAMALVLPFIAHSAADMGRAARHLVQYFNAQGITGFKEPMAFEPDLVAYAQADDDGCLTLHMAAHLARQSPFGAGFTPMAVLADWRDRYARPHLKTDYAKLFLDGVAPSHTAAFLEAYVGTDPATHDPEAMLLLKPDLLAAEVTALDAAGFTVKMHAVGDRAARAGLDGIEAARRTNGDSGLRHEIAHSPFVTDIDKPRFAALNAVAEVSPKLWYPNPVTAGQRAVLGPERVDRCHQIRGLLDAGATVIYGSDWPAAAMAPAPWEGLAGMISRRDPTGRFPGTVGADQAITLDEALTILTVNGAAAMGRAGQTGVLKSGASADLVVLERPLDSMTPEEIAAVTPAATLFEGRCVHGAL